MRLALPIVRSDRHRLHEPGGEVWIGVRTPGTEVPRRAEAIRDALRARDATFLDAVAHPDEDVLAVHDAALLDDGAPAAYACCRPPGRYVTRTAHGGSCYLNNAAAAAARLLARTDRPVAVIDIDAHHGNGTQAIFYDRADVLTASVHVDPGAGWFPHYPGFAGETGTGDGTGANRNAPLEPGCGDDPWLAAIDELAAGARDGGARALVVALGVDAAAGDPESPLTVTAAGYREAGRTIGALNLPTALVQEGGYDLTTIGALVAETLAGVQEGMTRA